MVEELSPLPEEVGGAACVGDEFVLDADGVGDEAGVGAIGASGCADAVCVSGFGEADEGLFGGALGGVGFVIAEAVERRGFGGEVEVWLSGGVAFALGGEFASAEGPGDGDSVVAFVVEVVGCPVVGGVILSGDGAEDEGDESEGEEAVADEGL